MQEIQQNNMDKRVWPKLPGFVYEDLCDFAKEERRTASEMAAIFIENGIKERKRKRKDVKKDNI